MVKVSALFCVILLSGLCTLSSAQNILHYTIGGVPYSTTNTTVRINGMQQDVVVRADFSLLNNFDLEISNARSVSYNPRKRR